MKFLPMFEYELKFVKMQFEVKSMSINNNNKQNPWNR